MPLGHFSDAVSRFRVVRAAVTCQCLSVPAVFHQRIFPVHVIQNVRVDKCVVQSGIEYFSLVFSSAFHLYAGKVAVPFFISIGLYLVEVETVLLGIKVHPGILAADERNAHLDAYLLALGDIVITEPETHVVSGDFPRVTCVELVFSLVRVPCCLRCHRALLLPVTAG